MDKTIIARHIKKEWANFANVVEHNKEKIGTKECRQFLEENGYTTMPTPFMGIYADKNGLRFYCGRYASTYELHFEYGFYVGSRGWEHGKYVHIYNVDKEIEAILSTGYQLPENHYVRNESVAACIQRIKREISEAKPLIHGSGTLGDRLYANGCRVGYDGASVCDFTKGFIHYHAHNDYPGGWRLEDSFNVYIGDDVLSRTFTLEKAEEAFLLERDFEAIFGDVPTFGRQLSEKDKVASYKKFRVRSYVPRELTTIGWFDSFEEAKTFAFEKAKKLAESVKDDRRRYAHLTPTDVSDRYDYLAAYIWYSAGRGSEHMIFVQGEYE